MTTMKTIFLCCSQLDIDTGDLEALLDELEPQLGILLSNFTDLTAIATSKSWFNLIGGWANVPAFPPKHYAKK